MADEVRNANVVRVFRDGARWCALIGPDLQSGLAWFSDTPETALVGLSLMLALGGWHFDETWREGKTGFHSA